MIDDSVSQASIRVDLDDATYAEAAQSLKMLTGTFFVPLDETHVIVAKDSLDKRTQFDRILAEDVSLPGTPAADLTALTTLLKSLFNLKQISASADRGAISLRGTETELENVNKTIADLVEGKGQVLLEMRLYQIDKQRTTNIGVQLPTSNTLFNVPAALNGLIAQNQSLIDQLISAGLVAPGDNAAIAALLVFYGLAGNSLLGQPFGVFGGGQTLTGYTLGQATLNLQLNQSEARALDIMQLRVADQDTATIRSGTRFPVITGSFSPLAASTNLPPALLAALGGAAAAGADTTGFAAPPQIQYEDLGLTLKATPRVDRDGTVRIALDFKIQALTGQSANGIPLLANRQFTSNVSAKDGDSVMLVSTLSREESRALSGIPGVSELPGRLYTNHQRQFNTTNLVLIMTPHIVRRAHAEMSAPMIPIPPHS
jgi:type II secretory pathway component GspD/PulD (secretin)